MWKITSGIIVKFWRFETVYRSRKNMKKFVNQPHRTTLKKKIWRYRHNCGSLTYIILEIYRKGENQGLLVLVQPVCVFQTYELLLQQYFWLTAKYFLLNYLKTISYIHMADKSQAFLSVQNCENNIFCVFEKVQNSKADIWWCS